MGAAIICAQKAVERRFGSEKEKIDKPSDPYSELSVSQKVHAAACNDDVELIDRLAEQGADFNEPRDQDGLRALDACAWSGSGAGALALLRHGADPKQTVQAIVGAAAWGKPELLKKLLDGGGDMNQEHSNYTALRWAVEMSHEECAVVLMLAGAWKTEPEQDVIVAQARRRRLRTFLAAVAEQDPVRAKDCILPPWWKCDGCAVL
mmetsp:Transcript_70944/g.154132  ORF Transcript_70944/g.154132 Transcript_70944/m.154132 type:complete len:206 (+) Transcript_70944:73-690(+)